MRGVAARQRLRVLCALHATQRLDKRFGRVAGAVAAAAVAPIAAISALRKRAGCHRASAEWGAGRHQLSRGRRSAAGQRQGSGMDGGHCAAASIPDEHARGSPSRLCEPRAACCTRDTPPVVDMRRPRAVACALNAVQSRAGACVVAHTPAAMHGRRGACMPGAPDDRLPNMHTSSSQACDP
eukprot:188054-Chlamydomonas_euryale.AAC.3